MKKGFTIIEILVSMIILTIGVLAVVILFPSGFRLSAVSKEMTVATNLAQEKMEEKFALTYENLTVGTEAKQRVSSDPNNPFYPYQRETKVFYVNPSNLSLSQTDSGLKEIEVTVFFQERGQEKTITLRNLKAKK